MSITLNTRFDFSYFIVLNIHSVLRIFVNFVSNSTTKRYEKNYDFKNERNKMRMATWNIRALNRDQEIVKKLPEYIIDICVLQETK